MLLGHLGPSSEGDGKESPLGDSGRPWDVIIVGARVAGATLAAYLGQAGLRVLLLERARFPADFAQQGAWEAPTEQRWASIGALPLIEAIGPPWRHGYYAATEDVVLTYRFPPDDLAHSSRMMRRRVLDDLLARHAGSLPTVELRLGCTASELLWDGDRVVGVRAKEDGRSYKECATLVVGADGRHSWLARLVQAPEYVRIVSPKANYIADYANTNVEPEMTARVWDSVGSMGMGMMEDGLVTIGMGVPLAELDAFRAGLPDSFEQRLRRHPLYRDLLDGAVRASKIGGAVDLAMYKRRPYGPGWALVGDAGYHLDPLAARGVTAAVASAELLARAIVDAHGGSVPETTAFGRFHAERDEILAPEWDVTYGAIMREPPTERDVAEARLLADRPELVALHIEIMQGKRPAAELEVIFDAALGPGEASPSGRDVGDRLSV
jgi:flavin-dependent dehydrogenase